MAFVLNSADTKQLSFTDSLNFLTEREGRILDRSWANPFAEIVFSAIDEKPFSVLYSKKDSRPNTPVNVIIGALIIKELVGCSDDEILESLLSASFRKPIQSQMCVLGNMSIGGTISKVEELAITMQACLNAGAKKLLLPMSSAADMGTVPSELSAKFQTSFYTSPEDAVFKALGLE